jgi:hypothetical protein
LRHHRMSRRHARPRHPAAPKGARPRSCAPWASPVAPGRPCTPAHWARAVTIHHGRRGIAVRGRRHMPQRPPDNPGSNRETTANTPVTAPAGTSRGAKRPPEARTRHVRMRDGGAKTCATHRPGMRPGGWPATDKAAGRPQIASAATSRPSA